MIRSALRWVLWMDIRLMLPFHLLHESCHYLVARAFGYRAKFTWYKTTIFGEPRPLAVICVSLAPAVAALPLGLVLLLPPVIPRWLVAVAVAFLIWWELSCLMDLVTLVQFLLFRHRSAPPRFPKPVAPIHGLFLPDQFDSPFHRAKKHRE